MTLNRQINTGFKKEERNIELTCVKDCMVNGKTFKKGQVITVKSKEAKALLSKNKDTFNINME